MAFITPQNKIWKKVTENSICMWIDNRIHMDMCVLSSTKAFILHVPHAYKHTTFYWKYSHLNKLKVIAEENATADAASAADAAAAAVDDRSTFELIFDSKLYD